MEKKTNEKMDEEMEEKMTTGYGKERNFNVMKAVYCYFFPEVREVLKGMRLPEELFMVTARADEVKGKLRHYGIELDITDIDGRVDLDMIHEPIIKRIVAAYGDVVPALSGFGDAYPTSGSSEGIFHLLARLRTAGVRHIYVLDGEYEGYAAQCANLGMEAISVKEEDAMHVEAGYWFISNPSARDGNIIHDNLIDGLCERGHKVVLDLAYVGNTRPHVFDVSHENIIAVVMSFSKPYGVFRFRIGGFMFSREAIPSLYGNKWFKDIVRLFDALRLAEEIGPGTLHKRYKGMQDSIIKGLNRDFGIGMHPSDAFLLGYLPVADARHLEPWQKELIEPFRRGDSYRFCLTPYFEMHERILEDEENGEHV